MDTIQDLRKCPLIERSQSKALSAKLTFGFLATQHLVPRLHCNLVACQQKAQATSRLLIRS